jgi:DNA-binding HxlR family transcriptional regulator
LKTTTIVYQDPGDVPVALLTPPTGKWTLVIVEHLAGNRLRFNQLRREVEGISQKTLAATLRSLERDGYVVRTLYPTIPPRVEYELTPLGAEFLDLVGAWQEFAQRHQAFVEDSRRRFDEATGVDPLPYVVRLR